MSDRALYRAIQRHRWQRILEIGVGSGRRALRMLDVASQPPPERGSVLRRHRPVRSATGGRPGLSLKEAHCQFKARQFKAQLLPGDPYAALARAANALRNIDLVVISADQNAASLAAGLVLSTAGAARQVGRLPGAGRPRGDLGRWSPWTGPTIDARAQKPHRRGVA